MIESADAALRAVLGDPRRPVEKLGRDQLAAMPALLAPVIRARIIATAAKEWVAAHPTNHDGLVDASWIVAFAEQQTSEASAGIAAWQALTSDVHAESGGAVRTAIAFEQLLDNAASATTTYLRDVLGLTPDSARHTPTLAIAARAGELADARIKADADASLSPLAQAVVRNASSVAGWTLQAQLFDVVGDYNGDSNSEQSARTAIEIAQVFACRTVARKLDPSWPVWSTQRSIKLAEQAAKDTRDNAWLSTAAVATAAQLALAMQSVHPVVAG